MPKSIHLFARMSDKYPYLKDPRWSESLDAREGETHISTVKDLPDNYDISRARAALALEVVAVGDERMAP